MAKYDPLINAMHRCINNPTFNALQSVSLLEQSVNIIEHLQSVVRNYNSDDAIFDDEKDSSLGSV